MILYPIYTNSGTTTMTSGHISEIAAILCGLKLFTALPSFFYGGPIGFLSFTVLVLLVLLIWHLANSLIQPPPEYGEVQRSPIVSSIVFCGSLFLVGGPAAVQAETMMSAPQMAHLQCVAATYGTNTDKCFAKWVKAEQSRAAKQS